MADATADLTALEARALEELKACSDEAALRAWHIKYLGDKGLVKLAFGRMKDSLGFIDLLRETTPEPQKLASWWSYRALDFRKSNRGLRLDHILVTPGLKDAAFRQGCAAARIHDDVREWDRPSDHAPVSADLAL